MRIYIRADTSTEIGIGHIIRCLTLSNRLKEEGAEIIFITQQLPEQMNNILLQRGHGVQVLQESSLTPTFNWKSDAKETRSILKNESTKPEWLIIDHYMIDTKWETEMRSLVKGIMVIDDRANRVHDCDILLDHNFYRNYSERYKGLVPTSCKVLLGPQYALIRPEFFQTRKTMVHRDGMVRRIFVFFGGSDPTNETAKTLRAIKNLATRSLSIDVVVGALNPFKHEIEQLCSEMTNTKYYCAPVNMFEFMAKADLAIGAGGITTWERCCMGLPSIVISTAPNQDSSIIEMAEDGRLIFLGQSNSVSMEYLRVSIEHVINNPSLCRFLGKASKDLVDGYGLERVVNILFPEKIILRPATYEDCENIFSWRQYNQTRKFSFNKKLISFKEHQNWFLKAIENPDKMIFIGEIRGDPVGVLRYDVEGEGAAVSVYLVPGKYGRGYGPLLLTEGNKWLKHQRAELKFVYAHIIPENIASIKAFAKAGFKHDHSIYKRDLHDETYTS